MLRRPSVLWRRFMILGARRRFALSLFCLIAVVLTATAILGAPPRPAQAASAHTTRGYSQSAQWLKDGAWFQRLVYVFASGDPAIQQMAWATGKHTGLTAAQVTQVSRAVRSAWLRIMRDDPASVGRVGAKPLYAKQQVVLRGLREALARIAGRRYRSLLNAADRVYTQISDPQWLLTHVGGAALATSPGTTPARYMLVYATSFSIPNTPSSEQYVALPDTYLKYVTLGWYGRIPLIYQPYYMLKRDGLARAYTVDIAKTNGVIVVRGAPTLDVGPWNEDDNWWDPMNPTATLASNCPVASAPLTSAFTNAQVDGICPGAQNWRRIAYYLLYKHYQLPFFQPNAYAPTGTYTNATLWPGVIPQGCPEAALASVNNDGSACAPSGYNGSNGAWLRNGTYNSPVLNQAGIDLSPATDASLGWTWPSSGFILVNVARLP